MTPVLNITEQERAARADALRATLAELRLEGLPLGPEARAIFQQHVEGELTLEEMEAAMDELNDREFGPVHVSRH